MRNDPLAIAFIGGRGVGSTYSGIETYYEEVGSRLAQHGHAVTVYCRNYFTPDVDTYRGMHVRRLPAMRSKHLDTLSHSVLCTIDALRHRYDIIQYHAIGSAPLSLVPRLLGGVTVASVRGLDWQRGKWGGAARAYLRFGEWASARCPTATVVVSRTLQEHYARRHASMSFLIPNAIIAAAPRPADRIHSFGIQKDSFLLFGGRLSPEKGIHTLLEALRPLNPRMPLVLAGGGSYSDAYVARLKRSAWDGVRFLGSVNHQTMAELYSNCYAYVLPSVMEGLSVGLLEALSYGACIVTSNIPENIEVVGSAALSFPPGDASALRGLLGRLLGNPGLVHHYRMLARQRALTQPDWDEVTRRTERLYYGLLAGESRAHIENEIVAQ